jgi:DNA invertase Pin-like site-specific DNA recombinase
MPGQNVGYIRVSTVEQNIARQLDGVHLDKTFTDRASGKSTDRPQLAACLEYCREGDTLHVHSMDRLARNLEDLLRLVRELTAKGVMVSFHKEKQTFSGDSDPMAMLMLQLLGAFAGFERQLLLERVREGVAIAKAAGKYKGGHKKLSDERAAQLRARVGQGIPKAKVAREFGISRDTLYSYLSQPEPTPIERQKTIEGTAVGSGGT